MVVEELLKLLVDKVDGDLLESVVLEHLKAGDVEDSDKVVLFLERNYKLGKEWDKKSFISILILILTMVESIRVSLLGI